MIQILGEEWVGFWAILDQILFYEGMIDELTTLNATPGGSEISDSESINRKGVDEALSATQKVRNIMGLGPLNEDSDLEIVDNDG